MRSKLYALVAGFALAMTGAVIAQQSTVSGSSSRPRFQAVGVGTAAPAAGNLTASGTVTAGALTTAGALSAANVVSTGSANPSVAASSVTLAGGASGQIWQVNTAAPANNRIWSLYVDGTTGGLVGRVANDAIGAVGNWLNVTRSGTTVTSVNLQGTAIQGNGVDMTPTTGTFTLTLTTGCTTSPSVTARYAKVGSLVTLNWPAFAVCTSNATTRVLSGLPAALSPVAAIDLNSCNSANNGGAAVISACGIGAGTTVVAVSNGASPGNAFTASGLTQIYGASVSYPVN